MSAPSADVAALFSPDAIQRVDPRDHARRLADPDFQATLAARQDLHDRRQRLLADEHATRLMARMQAVLDRCTNLDDPKQLNATLRAGATLGRVCLNLRAPARLRSRAGAAPSPSPATNPPRAQAPPPPLRTAPQPPPVPPRIVQHSPHPRFVQIRNPGPHDHPHQPQPTPQPTPTPPTAPPSSSPVSLSRCIAVSLPPPTLWHPIPNDSPQGAVEAQLHALRTNDDPRPCTGIATVHAFTLDERGRQPAWAVFLADFLKRLAHVLLGFTSFRTRCTARARTRNIDTASIRVDLDFPGGRAAAVRFDLVQVPIPGSLPTWFNRSIEILDSS